jgi:signal transduction histidine kinase
LAKLAVALCGRSKLSVPMNLLPASHALMPAIRVFRMLLALAFGVGLKPACGEVLREIDAIRHLVGQPAVFGTAVEISGTCIYEANGEFFLHDGSHGIWVSTLTAKSKGLLEDGSGLDGLEVGSALEVKGITDPGGYAVQVLPISIRRTEEGTLPPPLRITAEQLVAGNEDGQRVVIEGVVQEVRVLEDRTVLSMIVEGMPCWIGLHGRAAVDLPPLVDARIAATGAFAPDFNNRSQAVLPKVIISAPDSIRILKPPPADPFEAEPVSLLRLRAFSPEVTLFHRTVTSGIVTFVRPGEFFFLREGDITVRVSSSSTDIRPGWEVKVAGFIDLTSHLAALKNGIVRKTGESHPPPPEPVSAHELLVSASWREFASAHKADLSGHTVTLRGQIRRIDRHSPELPVAVWIESDSVLFPVHLPPDVSLDAKRSQLWQVGAEASITGACELEFPGAPDPLGLYNPRGFHLWLASTDDLEILRAAPWWTTRRLTIALLGTALAALAAFGGVAVLRRQVKKQVSILSHELETKAVATERERMARDLHDTLEQQLTGVAMQLESIAKHPASHEPGVSRRLDLAGRMIRHSREEARRSVWDLRNRVLETHGLPAALQSLAESAAIDGGPEVHVDISGTPLPLESNIGYQLLRMAQEALGNALKHARAASIRISLEMSSERYLLVVRDDGVGFDVSLADPHAAPRFGLIGMRERASKIGASLEIISQPGSGCAVSITLPVSSS